MHTEPMKQLVFPDTAKPQPHLATCGRSSLTPGSPASYLGLSENGRDIKKDFF